MRLSFGPYCSRLLVLILGGAISGGIVSAVNADFSNPGLQLIYNYGDWSGSNINSVPLAISDVPGFPNLLGVAGKFGRVDLIDRTMPGVFSKELLLQIPNDEDSLFDDVPNMYVASYESGMAGLTFHPNFDKPGMPGYRKFYVNASFDNSVVPGNPFIQVGDPSAITAEELTTLNQAARNDLIDGVPDSPLRQCFICDHPPMQMEMRVSNGTSGEYAGVECFFEDALGNPFGHKPAQALNPMYTEVREYMVNDNGSPTNPANWTVDTTFKTVLRFAKPRDFHNGGWVDFGEDGMLYITTGDNKGHPLEVHTYPEAPTVDLHGKVLRIDVNGPDMFPGDDSDDPLIRNYSIPADNPFGNEVYAYGFRNPWRASFDRVTGALWVGDVGFSQREEIDQVTAGFFGGWPYYEGPVDNQLENTGFYTVDPDGDGPLPLHGPKPNFADTGAPAYAYSHPKRNDRTTAADNPTLSNPASFDPDRFQHDPNYFDPFYRRGAAVMGGVVYRGPDPTLQGKYIFYESGQRQILMLDPNLNPADPNYVTDISDKFFTYYDATLYGAPPLTDWDDLNGNGQLDDGPDSGNACSPGEGFECFDYPSLEVKTQDAADGYGVGLFVTFGEDGDGNIYFVNYFAGRVYKLNTSNPDPDSIPPGMPGTKGDFNSDGLVNAKDIDLLALAAKNDPTNPLYDLNGPLYGGIDTNGVTFAPSEGGMILSDSDVLLREIMMKEYGDLDLNGQVDLGDANVLAFNFNDPGSFGWADGNIDGLSGVSLGDANILAFFFEFGPPGTAASAAVPEPSGSLLTLCAIFVVFSSRFGAARKSF